MANKNEKIYEPLLFQAVNEDNLTFDEAFQRICSFVEKDPIGNYRLMIGTDSQVHGKHTVFATMLIIHKEGKPPWSCTRKIRHNRKFDNLHEKISTETSYTEEVAYLLSETHKQTLHDIVLPYVYQGSNLSIEGHIDIGPEPKSKTNVFVREMVSRIKSAGLEPKIKPFSTAASSGANWHTK